MGTKIYNNCIYSITFTVNNKIYIGQSECNITRWASHVSALMKGTHHNKGLTAIFREHGLQVFKFEVLHYDIPDRSAMLDLEESIVALYDTQILLNDNTAKIPTHFTLLDWETYSIYTVNRDYMFKTYGYTTVKSAYVRLKGKVKERGIASIGLSEWISLFLSEEEAASYLSSKGVRKTIVCERKADRKITKYKSAALAAEVTGWSASYIIARTLDQAVDIDCPYHFYEVGKKAYIEKEYFEPGMNAINLQNQKGVSAEKDGEVIDFPSIGRAAAHFDVETSLVRRNILSNKPISKGKLYGWNFYRS